MEAEDRVMRSGFSIVNNVIKDQLEKKGVEIRLEEKFLDSTIYSRCNRYKTSKGFIEADIVYLCTGKEIQFKSTLFTQFTPSPCTHPSISLSLSLCSPFLPPSLGLVPNADFIKTLDPDLLEEDGHVKTEPDLRLKGYKNIFVGGDIKNFGEEKLTLVGEGDGILITRNIINLEIGKRTIEKGKKESLDFQYRANYQMISLGPETAVVGQLTPREDVIFDHSFDSIKRGLAAHQKGIFNREVEFNQVFGGKLPNMQKKELLKLIVKNQ